MTKALIASTILGTAVATSGGSIAAYKWLDNPAASEENQAVSELALVDEHGLSQPVSLDSDYVSPATFARVVSVTPVQETTSSPRQICHDEVVQTPQQPKDQHQITGIALGAVVGGLLGNQVGDGRGRDLATLAGAVAGGFGGKKVQQQVQTNKTVATVEQRCETVYDQQVKVRGYTVQYEVNGQMSTVHMDYDPGTQIPINNGVLMI